MYEIYNSVKDYNNKLNKKQKDRKIGIRLQFKHLCKILQKWNKNKHLADRVSFSYQAIKRHHKYHHQL